MTASARRPGAWAAAVAIAVALVLAMVEGAVPATVVNGRGTLGTVAGPSHAVPQPPDGKTVYATTCAACHGLDGTGLTDVYPPLAESDWVTGDEERLIRIVLHGLTGEIEVGGEMFSGAMPAWGPSLDDVQLAAVLTYIRKSWGNAAPAVAPATAARVRRATASRSTPWTAPELSAKRPPPG